METRVAILVLLLVSVGVLHACRSSFPRRAPRSTERVSNGYTDPHCVGDSHVIVYLAEWKWSDIERECPRLADMGYCAVQTSTPTEHETGGEDTWWQRLRPVSYKVVSRSGNESQFRSMVQACNDVGIRIIVDLELNHMSRGDGRGSAGSRFDSSKFEYPGVPYNSSHFHKGAPCDSLDYRKITPQDLQHCSLNGNPDLDQSNLYVKDTMVNLLNYLLSMGVAGFHMEDSIYIAPEDFKNILDAVHDVEWGGRPFVAYRVDTTTPTPVKPSWFYPIGRVSEFTIPESLGEVLTFSRDLSGLCDLLTSPDHIPSNNSLVFVDDMYLQRFIPTWLIVASYMAPELHVTATSFILASGYGLPRILSSFDFHDKEEGPPLDQNGTVKDALTADGDCATGWVCEHRWPEIQAMVQFSNLLLHHKDLHNCVATKDSISFTRGDKGYYWASLHPLNESAILAALPAGRYLDVVTNKTREVHHQTGSSTLDLQGRTLVALIRQGENAAPAIEAETTLPPLTTTSVEEVTTSAEDNEIGLIQLMPEVPAEGTTSKVPSQETTAQILGKETATEVQRKEVTTEAPAGKTTAEVPRTETTAEVPQTETTAEVPRTETTVDVPRTETTAEVPPQEITKETTTTAKVFVTTKTTIKPILATKATAIGAVPLKDIRRTVIFLYKHTGFGESVFLRGRNIDPDVSDTSIPIKHTYSSVSGDVGMRNNWAYGNNHLNWNGREQTQTGVGRGGLAKGTPAQWTTNKLGDEFYTPLNTFEPHMWMVDVYMDCDRTYKGFFEVRGVLQDGTTFEEASRRKLGVRCTDGGHAVPKETDYHLAQCGKINVFYWNDPFCRKKNFYN